mgnify:FL=1
MSLDAEQMAFRAAREACEGEVAYLGGGLAARVRRYLPPSVGVVAEGRGGQRVDVAFVSASKICCRGGLVSSTRTGAKPGCDCSSALDCAAARIVVVMPHTVEGEASIVEHRAEHTGEGNGEPHRCIITELALMEVTEKGLVLRELAPGISAREVQHATGTLLLVGPELVEMVFPHPLP